MPERREIVLYIPAGGHRATAGIPRGSAIVGRPRVEVDEVEIHFEAGGPDLRRRESLADRALIASGRLLEGVEGESSRSVSREALLAVGVFLFGEGRIVLTGKHSVRALADWLGLARLGRAELRRGGAPPVGVQALAGTGPQEFSSARLDPALLWALLERGGVVAEGEEWLDTDGRRTTEVGDALIWALERLARGS
jgi:hypothetical protein